MKLSLVFPGITDVGFNSCGEDGASHCGDLDDLVAKGRSEASFRFQDGLPLEISGAKNLDPGESPWMFRSTTTDPQFLFEFSPALDPREWRYLFVDVELSASSRGQFVWWTAEKKYQATRHFRIPFGRRAFAFDLARRKTYQRQVGDGIAWNDGAISRLQFDPAEIAGVEVGLHRVWLLKQPCDQAAAEGKGGGPAMLVKSRQLRSAALRPRAAAGFENADDIMAGREGVSAHVAIHSFGAN